MVNHDYLCYQLVTFVPLQKIGHHHLFLLSVINEDHFPMIFFTPYFHFRVPSLAQWVYINVTFSAHEKKKKYILSVIYIICFFSSHLYICMVHYLSQFYSFFFQITAVCLSTIAYTHTPLNDHFDSIFFLLKLGKLLVTTKNTLLLQKKHLEL